MMGADINGVDRTRSGRSGVLGVAIPGSGLHEASDGHVFYVAIGTAGAGFQGLLQFMRDYVASNLPLSLEHRKHFMNRVRGVPVDARREFVSEIRDVLEHRASYDNDFMGQWSKWQKSLVQMGGKL